MIEQHLDSAQIYSSRPAIYNFLFEEFKNLPGGLNLEFGVSTGGSLKIFASKLGFVYGFDSFLGLEQNWSSPIAKKGPFNLNTRIPNSAQNIINSKLVVGRVEDTVTDFLRDNDSKVSFVHMD